MLPEVCMAGTQTGDAPVAARDLAALGKLGPVRQIAPSVVVVKSFLGDEPMFVSSSFVDFGGLGQLWANQFPQKTVPTGYVVGPFCNPTAAGQQGFRYVRVVVGQGVRVNNLANLEALKNIIANGME